MGAFQTYVSGLSPQPVLWFKLDEANATVPIVNSGTSANNFSATGTVKNTTGGKDTGYWNLTPSTTLNFAGGDNTSIIPAYLNYTFSFWIKRNLPGVGTYAGTFPIAYTSSSTAYKVTSGNSASIEDDGKMYYYAFHNNVAHSILASDDLRTNQWILITITRASNVMKLYQNGVLKQSVTDAGTGSSPGLTGTWTFTHAGFGGTGIDEITLFDYTMTDQQVLDLFNHVSSTPVNFNASAATVSALHVNSTISTQAIILSDPLTASAQFVEPLIVSVSSNIAVDFSTASALLVQPNLIITSNDATITTSPANTSALMVNPSSIIAQINISNASGTLDASVDIGEHVSIAGSGTSYPPQPITASADIVHPTFAGSTGKNILADVFSVTPEFVHPTVSTPLTYPGLVLQSNPLLYIYDGDENNTYNYGSANFGMPDFQAPWSTILSGTPMGNNGDGYSWRIGNVGNTQSEVTWATENTASTLQSCIQVEILHMSFGLN
jgi:hypothetical protein